MITQAYNINMIPGGVQVHIPCSQRDDASRTVVFNMFNGSELFTPSGASARIDGTRPDGGTFTTVANLSGSTATWVIPLDATSAAGEVISELIVVSNGEILGSANFKIDVEEYAKDPNIPVTPEETSLWEQMYNQTSVLLGVATNAANSASASASSASSSATAAAASAAQAITYALSLNMTNNVISLVGSDSSTSTITLPVYDGGVTT